MTAEAINQQLSPLKHHDIWQPELFLTAQAGPESVHLHQQHSVIETTVPARIAQKFMCGDKLTQGNIIQFQEVYPVLHVAACKHGSDKVQMLAIFGLS